MGGVVMRQHPCGVVDVIEAPAVAEFSSTLVDGSVGVPGLSVHGDLILCGSLNGRGARYRIVERGEHVVVAELETVLR